MYLTVGYAYVTTLWIDKGHECLYGICTVTIILTSTLVQNITLKGHQHSLCGIYYIMPEGIIFLRCLVAIYFSAVKYIIERDGRELAHVKLNKT